MSGKVTNPAALGSHQRTADGGSTRERPAFRDAEAPPPGRNTDGNARLTGISASFVLALFLFEVVTVVLGVRSVITLHVVVGLILLGPFLLKLANVTYRMASYYRGVSEYRQRGKPAGGLRLVGGALALFFPLLLASGLVLIAGPNGAHSAARAIHVVTAYLVALLLVVHLAIHLLSAARLVSADIRPRTTAVRGARARWLALFASLALGGVLALLLGDHGSSYLHHYYPRPSQRSPISAPAGLHGPHLSRSRSLPRRDATGPPSDTQQPDSEALSSASKERE